MLHSNRSKVGQITLSKSTVLCISLLMILNCPAASWAQNVSELHPLKEKADNLLAASDVLPALKIYKQIVSTEPGFANCYYNMAICYHELGQFEKAYCCLEEFVKLNPEDSEAFFNMAMLQVYLGQNEKARALLFKARALQPSREIRRRIKEALDHLQPSLFPEESLAEIQAYLNQRA